ncbi:MAG TPA: hypothetical protein VML55_14540 [Planctomycetaceae bacterium]|nr:hypothetical protein [Planctomycetaceae bacterium]
MTDSGSRRLSIEEAARLIYQTDEPTAPQLSKLRYTVARGVLKGSTAENWVATDSVAAYLAARIVKSTADRAAVRSGPARQDSGADAAARPRRHGATGDLPHVYRGLLRDYLSAVLRHKDVPQASATFRVAVLIGQLVIVLFPIVVIVGAIRSTTGPPPERVAVERWIEQDTRKYEVLEWFPSEADRRGGVVVRVRYRYTSSGSPKPIVTDRRFRVADGAATLLSDTD